MLDAAVTPTKLEAVNDREQLGELLTQLRAQQPVRDLAAGVRDRIGERDAVSFSTISSWCRGKTVPNPRQFAAFEALLAEFGVSETSGWLEAVRRIRGADAAGKSPYPGLAPFSEADAASFCGRDALVDQTLACLVRISGHDSGGRMMALVGASGSGKTSLIHAGLLPRLRREGWEPQVVEIGNSPERALDSLTAPSGSRSVLVVDRLEQLLRPEVDETTQTAFLEALTADERQGVVVLVLRADFYDAAAAHPTLLRVLQSAQVLIGPMDMNELRAAVAGPAQAAGSSVPEGLLELVCSEAGARGKFSSAGLLPHLSHALHQTWNHGRRGRMSLSDYQAVGGLAGAIQLSAEVAYHELPPSGRDAVRQVFLRLVNVFDDGPLTRRSATRAELATISAAGGESIDLIEHLVAARLLIVSNDRVDIAHEALLTAWSRLAGWVEDARDALRTHASLRDATATWVSGGREAADLARGTALDAYATLVAGSAIATAEHEREFVEASNAAIRHGEIRRRQQVRRLRALLAGVTALALVVAILAMVAISAGRSAAQARDNALSRQIAITAQGLADRNPSVAALLAASAYAVSPTFEARSAVLELGNQPLPQRLLSGGGSKAVGLSEDGDLLVVSDSEAGTVELLTREDSGAYQPTGSIDVGGETYAVAFADGDEVLAIGGTGVEVTLWDVSDPAEPTALGEPLIGPEGPIQRVAFSPEGDELAAVGAGAGVYRWDVSSVNAPTPLATYDVPSDVTWNVSYSPNGHLLAASDQDGFIHLYRRATGREIGSIELPTLSEGRAIAFSPDSTQLAVGSTVDNTFGVWDVSNARTPRRIEAATKLFTSWVSDVKFSADGRYVAAGSSDTTVKIWDTATWTEQVTLPNPGIVTQLAFAADGTFAAVSIDGATRVWRVPEDLPINAPGSIFNVSTSPQTGTVAAVGTGSLQLISPGDDGPLTPTSQSSLLAETGSGAGTISPDGRFITQGHDRGLLELHRTDVDHPKTVKIMDDPQFGSVHDAAWSPDGQLVAAAGDQGLRFFDLSDPRHPVTTKTITDPTQPQVLTWHPTKRLLVVSYGSDIVRLYDATDPANPVMTAEVPVSADDGIWGLGFHPGGDILALGGDQAVIELMDISDPANPTRIGSPLRGLSSRIQWAAFSPDGRRLVATSNAGSAWVWDVRDPENPADFAILGPVDGPLFGVAFARNGYEFAAGGANRRLNVWSIDTHRVIDHICTDLGAPLTDEEWETHVRGVEFVKPC